MQAKILNVQAKNKKKKGGRKDGLLPYQSLY